LRFDLRRVFFKAQVSFFFLKGEQLNVEGLKKKEGKAKERRESERATEGQFHQHSTRSFYVLKLGAQLFCAYILGLYFIGVSLLAQKLLIER
jgi:hypothetical protein